MADCHFRTCGLDGGAAHGQRCGGEVEYDTVSVSSHPGNMQCVILVAGGKTHCRQTTENNMI